MHEEEEGGEEEAEKFARRIRNSFKKKFLVKKQSCCCFFQVYKYRHTYYLQTASSFGAAIAAQALSSIESATARLEEFVIRGLTGSRDIYIATTPAMC